MNEKKINLSLTKEEFVRLVKETDTDSWLWPILKTKIESMERRKAYSDYRTAKTDKEKADARTKYIKLRR